MHKKSIYFNLARNILVLSLMFAVSIMPALASSHREAPLIAFDPGADNTDVYTFRSMEANRSGFVTIISNFIPFQHPSGGPHFYPFDDSVLYEIKIDNTGDGREDITYQFRFTTQIVNPDTVLGMNTINQNGAITSLDDPDYNKPQTYTVTRVDSTTGRRGRVIATGMRVPPDNIGPRVTPNYETNLGQPAVFPMGNGRVFAGQRDEGFFVDLGGVFDGVNLRSIGAAGGVDTLRTFNVKTIAIEVPIQELTRSRAIPASSTAADAVIGVWSTTSRRSTRVLGADAFGNPAPGTMSNQGGFVQISRLGNPLVNELVIPLRLKDAFNAIPPTADAVAAPFVLDPELPKIIRFISGTLGIPGAQNAGAGVINIPPAPRQDLVAIFATGIAANTVPGAPTYTTFLSDGTPHEFQRLNVAIPVSTPGTAGFSRLGLLGNDLAGFPNGRRPQDDVVDIELRALLGGTPFTPAFNVFPNNAVGDGVGGNFEGFLTRFPYLQTPNPGNVRRGDDFPAVAPPANGAGAEEGFQLPTVDENGNFKR